MLRLLPGVVSLLAVLVYVNALSNGFVWDDSIILERQLAVFDSPIDVVLPPRGIPQYSPDYYRPVTIASYLFDRSVAEAWHGDAREPDAWPFHLSVVLAHALASGLVGRLALVLFGSAPAGAAGALAAGVLFAVHPIHTESVAWMAGRADVLAACFLLATLVLHSAPTTSVLRSSLVGLTVLGALGAKEIGVMVCLLLPLLDGLVLRRRLRLEGETMRRYVGVVASLAVYVVLRRAALGEFVGTAPGETDVLVSLDRIAGALAVYLAKLVWPFGLNAYVDTVPTNVPAVVASSSVALVLIAGAVALRRAERPVPSFCLAWILVTLLPSLTIVWKIPDTPVAERYLYVPSVGFCLLLGWMVARTVAASARRRSWAVAVAVSLVAVTWAIQTVRRNRVWHDDVRLWEDTGRKTLRSAMPLRSLATAYQRSGDTKRARYFFELALRRENTDLGLGVIHNNLGTLAMKDGDFAAAREHYEKAVEVRPGADTLFNLGLAILEEGRRSPRAAERSAGYFERAIALSPYDPDPRAALGQCQMLMGQIEKAIESFEQALSLGLNPASAERVRSTLRQLKETSPASAP